MDLIERQKAIEALTALEEHAPTARHLIAIYDCEDAIKALPSAQPEQRWISCSEKLPENGHYYLWCSDGGNVKSDYYWDGFENGKKFGYNIAAWMPLPKPYKEEQE